MKLIGDIFESKRTKKMFEKERYTKEEFYELTKRAKPLQSRHHANIMYQLTGGQITIIEKR